VDDVLAVVLALEEAVQEEEELSASTPIFAEDDEVETANDDPQVCQWWIEEYQPETLAYQGFCYPPHTPCAGTIIPGKKINQNHTVCADPKLGCCILTFPNETMVQLHGTTLETPIYKHANCADIDTDGKRPPYVNFDSDDHQNDTDLEGLDATIHAYAVIPCSDVQTPDNPSGIPLGTAVRVTNNVTGDCVEAVLGDCGGNDSDGCKILGYGEMSYTTVRAIHVYDGPERVIPDPITIVFGLKPDLKVCKHRPFTVTALARDVANAREVQLEEDLDTLFN